MPRKRRKNPIEQALAAKRESKHVEFKESFDPAASADWCGYIKPKPPAPAGEVELGSMLFLVISSPRPERPSTVAASRQAYWRWMAPKLKSKKALFAYPKAGRGVVVALDVRSHEELHELLNAWADIIPAEFQVIPLIDPAKAQRFLAKKKR